MTTNMFIGNIGNNDEDVSKKKRRKRLLGEPDRRGILAHSCFWKWNGMWSEVLHCLWDSYWYCFLGYSSLRRQEENQALALQREHRLNEQQNLRERNRGVFFESIPSNFAETDSAGNGRGYVITSEACEKLHEECVMKSIRRAADKCIVDESMRRELLDVQGEWKRLLKKRTLNSDWDFWNLFIFSND